MNEGWAPAASLPLCHQILRKIQQLKGRAQPILRIEVSETAVPCFPDDGSVDSNPEPLIRKRFESRLVIFNEHADMVQTFAVPVVEFFPDRLSTLAFK